MYRSVLQYKAIYEDFSKGTGMFDIVFRWLMANLVFFWLVIAILFLMMEMGSPGLFFFLSFSLGALICAISAFFTNSLVVQSVVFLIATGISFLFLHFWVKRKILKPGKHDATNVYALKGKRAKVLKRIEPGEVGKVKVYGEVWSARTLNKEVIEEGEKVEIVGVKGAHLIVEKIKKVKSQ